MDADSGMVHTVETTATNVHDSNKVVDLLQGTEEEVYGDSGYLGAEKKYLFRSRESCPCPGEGNDKCSL